MGSLHLPAEITGSFPVTGNTLTLRDRGTLTVQVGDQNPPTGQIIQGMTDAPMQQILLTAGSEEDVRVTSLTLRNTGGSGGTSAMLYNVRLCEDTNNDGYFGGSEPLLGTVTNWTSTSPWTVTTPVGG